MLEVIGMQKTKKKAKKTTNDFETEGSETEDKYLNQSFVHHEIMNFKLVRLSILIQGKMN